MKHTLSLNNNMRQYIAYKISHCKTNTRQNTLAYGQGFMQDKIIASRTFWWTHGC